MKIRISNEAIEAAAEAIYSHWQFAAEVPWVKGGNSLMQDKARDYARAALEAGLAAWPGMKEHSIQVPDDNSEDIRYVLKRIGIILPLETKEECTETQ